MITKTKRTYEEIEKIFSVALSNKHTYRDPIECCKPVADNMIKKKVSKEIELPIVEQSKDDIKGA